MKREHDPMLAPLITTMVTIVALSVLLLYASIHRTPEPVKPVTAPPTATFQVSAEEVRLIVALRDGGWFREEVGEVEVTIGKKVEE